MLSVKGKLGYFKNPGSSSVELYPEEFKSITSLQKSAIALNEIKQWPDYKKTPLYPLNDLADELNVSTIWYKDESKRFHLKSFKALGGAYAVGCVLQDKAAELTGRKPAMKDIKNQAYKHLLSDIVISCATDGNHGRSVAWGCQMFGCQCVIYIHRDVSQARQKAMEAFGAKVIRITGNYDDSVKQADADARLHNRIIVSDTSYQGYLDIPKKVALGYTVLLSEIVTQLKDEIPSHVFIQGGVGGLASAVCAYFWELWGEQRPRFIVVEPEAANCLQQSAIKGEPTIVSGDLDTLMAGLACGEVSILAWEILKPGVDDFLTVNEDSVPLTMKLLATGFNNDPKIEAGESAVAGLAALITAQDDQDISEKLNLNENSKILILGTEGATDAELYKQLIE